VSLDHVETDDVVPELSEGLPQALTQMSGTARQENPHRAEDKGTLGRLLYARLDRLPGG